AATTWWGRCSGGRSGRLTVGFALCGVTACRTRRSGRLTIGVSLGGVAAGGARRSRWWCGLPVAVGVLTVAGRTGGRSGRLAVRVAVAGLPVAGLAVAGLPVAGLAVAGWRTVAVGVLLVRVGLPVARLPVTG